MTIFPAVQSTSGKPVRIFSFNFLLLLFSLSLLTACGDEVVESRYVATSQIYADMRVTATSGNYATVEVQLLKDSADSGTYIEMVDDDQLLVTVGEEITPSGNLFDDIKESSQRTKLMEEGRKRTSTLFDFSLISGPWYVAFFDQVDLSEEFIINLERSRDGGAPNSRVRLPEAVKITQPQAGEEFSRASDSIVVNWQAAAAQHATSVAANAQCENGIAASWEPASFADDPGTATVDMSAFAALTGRCSLRITVERTKLGALDAQFLGGHISSHSQATVLVNSID